MATRGSYVHISMGELSGASDNIILMQFSTKIYGFEQKDSQGFENSYNSYEQYPLEKFFIFTIYQNYTLALNNRTLLMHIWVRILNDVQLAIFRPWALLLHLVRPQLLRNHFFWCRRKEYNQGFQETYTLYTFTRFCTSHGPPNAKKWQKVMFLHFFIFWNHPVNFQAPLLILSNYSVNLVCLGPVS